MQPSQSYNNLNQKLTQIQASLAHHLLTSNSLKPSSSTLSPKYPKIADVQKQNQILTYELKLLINLINKLQIHQSDNIYQFNIKQCHQLIKALGDVQMLEGKLEKLEGQGRRLRAERQEMRVKCEDLERKGKILGRKIQEFQKLGGISKIAQLKDNIKQLNDKYEKQVQQASKNIQQIKTLKNRCKILQNLNKQTEQKLSEALCKNILKFSPSPSPSCHPNKQNTPINTCSTSKEAEPTMKLELMSAKQEIRNLRSKIQHLQRQKMNERSRYKEKQNIYEKMVMKKNIFQIS